MMARLRYFARETLISLRRNLMMTLAGILTVAVSLALFGGVMLLKAWVDNGTEQIKGGVEAEIFMNVDATKEQIADVRTALDGDADVKSFKFLDKEAALTEFKRIFRKDPDLVKNVDADALARADLDAFDRFQASGEFLGFDDGLLDDCRCGDGRAAGLLACLLRGGFAAGREEKCCEAAQ